MPASARRSEYLMHTYCDPLMPFCLSMGNLELVDLAMALPEEGEELARDVALEAADGLELRVALSDAPGDVSLGPRVCPQPADGDDVQGAVCCPVAAAVEAMAVGLAGRGWDRADAAEGCETGFGVQALGVVAGREEQLRGGLVADRVLGHEVRSKLLDDGGDHAVEVGDLVVQLEVASGEGAERDPVGGCHVAVVGHVGAPGSQRPDQLHAGALA